MTAPVPNMLPYQSFGIRIVVAAFGVLAGALTGFGGTQFEDTPSLVFIHKFGLPWPVWGCLFFAYAVMITVGKPLARFYGFLFGAFLYAFYTIALLYNAIMADNPPPPYHKLNAVLLGGMFCVVGFHLFSAWFASRLADKERT